MSTDSVSQKLATRAAAGPATGPSVFDLIKKMTPQIARALPGTLDPDRFARIVATEVRKTPRLAACTAESLLGACMSAAQLGLEPGPLQQVYLVPRKNKGTDEVQLMIGYRGIIDLAMRSERVLDIDAHVVHDADFFDYAYGTEPHLTHRPALTDRGPAVCVYAVARLTAGGAPFVVLSLDEVAARRGRSQSGDRGPWATDWDAMARKSAVRALAAFLPQSTEFAAAQQVDETIRTEITDTIDAAPVRVVNETDTVESSGPAASSPPVADQPGGGELAGPSAVAASAPSPQPETDDEKPGMGTAQRIAMWAREAGLDDKGRKQFLLAWSEGAVGSAKDVPAEDVDLCRRTLQRLKNGDVRVEVIDENPALVKVSDGLVTTKTSMQSEYPPGEEPF